MHVEDVVVFCAGKDVAYRRFVRHFTLVPFAEMESASVARIFTLLLEFCLAKFSERVREQVGNIVDSTIKIFAGVRAELLPTPMRPHYVFTLKDLWRVF